MMPLKTVAKPYSLFFLNFIVIGLIFVIYLEHFLMDFSRMNQQGHREYKYDQE